MKRAGWIVVPLALVLNQSPPAWAGLLEVLIESGRVTVNAQDVPLGEILHALSKRAGVHVVLDAQRSTQPVTIRLEAKGFHEAIERLLREAGGGNYAISSSNSQGKVETFAFQEGGAAAPPPQGPPPAPPASASPPAYAVGDGSTPYAPAPREPDKKPATPSAPYGSIVTRSPGPAAGASPALDADDDDGPASPNAKDELAQEEYKRHLESIRGDLEKGAKKIEDED